MQEGASRWAVGWLLLLWYTQMIHLWQYRILVAVDDAGVPSIVRRVDVSAASV